MRASVCAEPADGAPFHMETGLVVDDPALEVAVRRLRPGIDEATFAAARAAFFDVVAAQPGFAFDRELMGADEHRVVLIGWSSKATFMDALGVLSQRAEMGAFFALLDVVAYQACAPA